MVAIELLKAAVKMGASVEICRDSSGHLVIYTGLQWDENGEVELFETEDGEEVG